jgi:hypothetical protein
MLNGVRRTPSKENHTAEGKANGKVGSLNQYGRYMGGAKTLNEAKLPEDDRGW